MPPKSKKGQARARRREREQVSAAAAAAESSSAPQLAQAETASTTGTTVEERYGGVQAENPDRRLPEARRVQPAPLGVTLPVVVPATTTSREGGSEAPNPPDVPSESAQPEGGQPPVPPGADTTQPAYTGKPLGHVVTQALARPGVGKRGRPMEVITNFFRMSVPEGNIYHYDVAMTPSEQKLPMKLTREVIKILRESHPTVFPQRDGPNAPANGTSYDGRKNLYAPRPLNFGNGRNEGEFEVDLSTNPARRRIFKVHLKYAAKVNPEVLERHLHGEQSHDPAVDTALMGLNVVVRMDPSERYPSKGRSFYTGNETKDLRCGIHLWRGFFQSVRPASGKLLLNVDISTCAMYQPGTLIALCLAATNKTRPVQLMNLQMWERSSLQRFISGVKVTIRGADGRPREVKKLSSVGANQTHFELRTNNVQNRVITVADYFTNVRGINLSFPGLPCAEVRSGALFPLELCSVPPGQIVRKQIPPDKVNEVVDFSTKRPAERLQSIQSSLDVLNHGHSPYVHDFELNIGTTPERAAARVIGPPTLQYGRGSKQATITPQHGAWNMIDKKFVSPSQVSSWAIMIFEPRDRFNNQVVQNMVRKLLENCMRTGLTILETDPVVDWGNGQSDIVKQLKSLGAKCRAKTKRIPQVLIVVLPANGNDIYTAVKHFGDIMVGVATQCLKSQNCRGSKDQFYANVCLKLNVKLGGINTVPDAKSLLTDPRTPTIVIGADVAHPAPGSDGRPSFTSLVASVDSGAAKYVAVSRVQQGREEMILDLHEMCKHVLEYFIKYQSMVEKRASPKPKRIIFYRDGVGEKQFLHVLSRELPLLQAACEELEIKATITFVIVGKRHHVRFFPAREADGDRSKNCPAGTLIDRDVVHPTDYDFYLQSHSGILGTSRPSHYSVLYDENKFSVDGLQGLSYALCHVYARATRSVSIPAPVYYADIVCARAKNHYDPNERLLQTETGSELDSSRARDILETFKSNYKPLHPNQASLMYFS